MKSNPEVDDLLDSFREVVGYKEGDFFSRKVRESTGDRGSFFPQSDADDFGKGVRFVPGEVTLARRRGENVVFVQDCGNPCCWYWQMPNSSRVYHWERHAFEQIAKANGKEDPESDGAGPCPSCGNPNTSGGTVQ